MAPLAILLLAYGLTACAISCCGGNPFTRPPSVPANLVNPPPAPHGVPAIRVRISQPVESITLATNGPYTIGCEGQVLSRSTPALPPTVFTYAAGAWQFGPMSANGRSLEIAPQSEGGHVRVGGVTYRGTVRLLAAGDRTLIAINHVDLESYLAGVLPRELYANWSFQTYRALAVAARSFAFYNIRTAPRGSDYDLGDDQASQCYGGFSAETEKSRNAVRQTQGQVLTCEGKIFLTQYSACCGGVVNGANVIRNAPPAPPLAGGQICTDCLACAKYRWPPVQVSKSDLHRALCACYSAAIDLGGVQEIRVASGTSYGRTVWLDILGTTPGKSIRLRAEDLRLVLLRCTAAGKKLYSMNCRLRDLGSAIEFYDGRGFGHGVGLCQWGAEGKAQKGLPAESILDFYYPGAKITKAY